MPVNYNFLPEINSVYVKCSGELTSDEITAYFTALAEDPSIPKGAAEIVDLTAIAFFDLDYTGAAEMPANYAPAMAEKEITATILFGASPINHGFSLLIATHFRKQMPEHIFRTVETYADALKILSEIRSGTQSGLLNNG